MSRPEITNPQEIARFQEQFYQENAVFMDSDRFAAGRASWALALNNHPVNQSEYEDLTGSLPRAIHDYHRVSAHLIEGALSGSEPRLGRLRQYISAGVPDSTLDMFRRAVSTGRILPFSSRPDIARSPYGMRIYEYNVDGGADKGNTQAINDCLSQALGRKTLGYGLARLFVEQVRNTHPDEEIITVATVLPDHYRTDYDAQNAYFAREANAAGRDLGVRWISRKLSELTVRNGIYTDIDGASARVNIVDKEFKLPGFLNSDASAATLGQPGYDFQAENAVIRAVLNDEADMLGTILPLQDKIMLAGAFDRNLEDIIVKFLGKDGMTRLENIRRWHTQSFVADPESPGINLNGEFISWEDLKKPNPEQGFVLKRGGDNFYTTGSKGVDFSIGKIPVTGGIPRKWDTQLEAALQRASLGTGFSIIQPIEQSRLYPVEYITSGNSPKGRMAEVPVRFAPYYVSTPDGFMLGSVLVTAGTDSEVSKFLGRDLSKTSFNIHGVRDNTYQAAELAYD